MTGDSEQRPLRRLIWVVVAILVSACVCLLLIQRKGTDDGRITVRGTVSVENQPLAIGQILFTPAPGGAGPSAAGRIAEGDYVIPAEVGPGAGEYQIRITTGEPPSAAGFVKRKPEPGARPEPGSNSLPAPRTSYVFTRVLDGSSARQDFDLTPDARQRSSERSGR